MSVYKIYYIISTYYVSKKYQILRLLRLSGHIAKAETVLQIQENQYLAIWAIKVIDNIAFINDESMLFLQQVEVWVFVVSLNPIFSLHCSISSVLLS